MARVQHVISDGIRAGTRYKVYVTQFTADDESPRSDAVQIIVGDNNPPPVPEFHLAADFGNGGFQRQGGTISVRVAWAPVVAADLAGYRFCGWWDFPQYQESITTYDKQYFQSAIATALFPPEMATWQGDGFYSGQFFYIGLQSYDISGNYSNIFIRRYQISDSTAPVMPTSDEHAPQITPGVWRCIVVVPPIDCPPNTVQYVRIYRDGTRCVATLPFTPNASIEYVDTLEATDGLNHFYNYSFVDFIGNESPRSATSLPAVARAIDTEMIDNEVIASMRTLWHTESGATIEAIRAALLAEAQRSRELANQLNAVTASYRELFDSFSVAAHTIELLSARATELEGRIEIANTAIQQNAEAISMTATRSDLDRVSGEITDEYKAMIRVQADSITQIVSNLNESSRAYSSIAQISDQIQLKVDRDGIISAINVTPEVIRIDGQRIHVTGNTLFDRDVCVKGKLYAGDVVLLDMNGNIIFGTGAAAQPPQVIPFGSTSEQNLNRFQVLPNNPNWQVVRAFDFNITSNNPFANVFAVNFAVSTYFSYAAKVASASFGVDIQFRFSVTGATVPQTTTEGRVTLSGGQYLDYAPAYEGERMLWQISGPHTGGQNLSLSAGTYHGELQIKAVPFGAACEYGSVYTGFDQVKVTY